MKKLLLLTTLCVVSATLSPTSVFAGDAVSAQLPTEMAIQNCQTSSGFKFGAADTTDTGVKRVKYQQCLHKLLVTAEEVLSPNLTKIANFQKTTLFSAQTTYINNSASSNYKKLETQIGVYNSMNIIISLTEQNKTKILNALSKTYQ